MDARRERQERRKDSRQTRRKTWKGVSLMKKKPNEQTGSSVYYIHPTKRSTAYHRQISLTFTTTITNSDDAEPQRWGFPPTMKAWRAVQAPQPGRDRANKHHGATALELSRRNGRSVQFRIRRSLTIFILKQRPARRVPSTCRSALFLSLSQPSTQP